MVDPMGNRWTNGAVNGNVELKNVIAHAAARYEHVMLAEALNSSALHLSKRTISGPGKYWDTGAFYSDNGSISTNGGLKLALRRRAKDMPERVHFPSIVIAQTNSYHGDTLGSMDCSEESDFFLYSNTIVPIV